jgi:hypothetical protein
MPNMSSLGHLVAELFPIFAIFDFENQKSMSEKHKKTAFLDPKTKTSNNSPSLWAVGLKLRQVVEEGLSYRLTNFGDNSPQSHREKDQNVEVKFSKI